MFGGWLSTSSCIVATAEFAPLKTVSLPLLYPLGTAGVREAKAGWIHVPSHPKPSWLECWWWVVTCSVLFVLVVMERSVIGKMMLMILCALQIQGTVLSSLAWCQEDCKAASTRSRVSRRIRETGSPQVKQFSRVSRHWFGDESHKQRLQSSDVFCSIVVW